MRIRLIPLAEQPVMPWANGGGSTRQVAIDPPDGSLQRGFRWRVSCAQVASNGPFSRLPGVDRSLWLVRGDGMRLEIAGRETVLAHVGQRVDFRGEEQVLATLMGGPCEDCNVMTMRDEVVVDASCRTLAADELLRFECEPQAVVLVLDGALRILDRPISLGVGDAATWDGPGRVECASPTPTTVLLARFR